MDPRERTANFQQLLRAVTDAALQNVWTAAPVEILSFNPTTWTCEVQVLTMTRREVPTGWPVPVGAIAQPKDKATFYIWERPTKMVNCPVYFVSGGGFTITAPPKKGDHALAVFGMRSIDEWWARGEVTKRVDLRTHSFADAFIFAGVRPRPKAANLPVDPNGLTITTDDGSVAMKFGSSVDITGNVNTSGNVNVGSGASGAFTTTDGQVVTVTNGIITNIE